MSSDREMVALTGAPAIAAIGVGKRYRIGQTAGAFRYRSLREDIAGLHRRRRPYGRSRMCRSMFVPERQWD